MADPAYQQLANILTRMAPLPETELAKLPGLFRPLELKKRRTFLEAWDSPDRAGFVVAGLLRLYNTASYLGITPVSLSRLRARAALASQ